MNTFKQSSKVSIIKGSHKNFLCFILHLKSYVRDSLGNTNNGVIRNLALELNGSGMEGFKLFSALVRQAKLSQAQKTRQAMQA